MHIGISTFTPSIFLVADKARKRSATDRQEALVAVVFSVLWFESYVNDLFGMVAWYSNAKLGKLPKPVSVLAHTHATVVDRSTTLSKKVDLLCLALKGTRIDRSSDLYRDFDLLVSLRNRLTHSRPVGLVAREEPRRLVPDDGDIRRRMWDRRLISEKAVELSQPTFIGLQSPVVAKWACDTAYHMAHGIGGWFPRGTWRHWARSQISGSPEEKRRNKHLVPMPKHARDET